MKLSVLPVSYFKDIVAGEMSIGEWAREGVQLGLDAIDISILFLTDRSSSALSSFRKEIENEGINVCGASTYPDFTHPEEAERVGQKKQICEDIKALSDAGTKVVRVTAGQGHPGIKVEEGISWAVEGLMTASETAQQCGMTVVFENHAKPGVWKYPDFDFPTENFLAIAQKLENIPIKIQFDTANPIAFGDDPLPILEKVIDRILVVHASDTGARGELKPVVIGTGLVPYAPIFRRLHEAGYDKWVSIEEASGTGAEGVKTAVQFVRRTWQETA